MKRSNLDGLVKITLAGAVLILLGLFIPRNTQGAGPTAWGKKGTAATTSAGLTAPFYPTRLCAKNEDATNGIYIDWTDGVAATTDNSTNIYLQPGQLYCFEFNPNSSPSRSMVIGIISTAGTPAYHIHAYRLQ